MRAIVPTTIHKPTLLFALLATALVTLPHAGHVPGTVFGFFAATLSFRLVGVWKKTLLPNRRLLLLITIAGVALVIIEQRSIFGLHAGTSLFVVALGLKLMELKRIRDLYIVIFLSFFVAVTQFLYNQTLIMGLYVLVVTGLLVTTLININVGKALKLKAQLKFAGVVIVQAFPVMILLFIFFPRIPTPQFGFPLRNTQALTGLGETLEPGQISRLIQSSALAFRVNFEDAIPPPAERYWRGPVFWNTDGKKWTLPAQKPRTAQSVEVSGKPYRYTVTLEPHGQKWLFALDIAADPPPDIVQTRALLLVAKKPVLNRHSYSLTSHTQYSTGKLSTRDKQLGLQLPNAPSYRINQLVTAWRRQAADTESIVQFALNLFHDEEFFYTLNPPLYDKKPIESFLFDLRRGFCEHFATAFVYLMRAAEVPARVVTGYQGGEFNTLGQFLEIRQSDAHAWAEVWIYGRGWVRVDPTSAVAPSRIEKEFDPLDQFASGGISFAGFDQSGLYTLIQQVRFVWATVDHAWHRWVIEYDNTSQSDLLAWMGIKDLNTLILILISAIVTSVLITAALLLYPRTLPTDKTVALYIKFCRQLTKTGLSKATTEGASDFAHRAMAKRPDLARAIGEITKLYQKIRYERTSTKTDLKELERRIRTFRV